jgi:hypothetical protein
MEIFVVKSNRVWEIQGSPAYSPMRHVVNVIRVASGRVEVGTYTTNTFAPDNFLRLKAIPIPGWYFGFWEGDASGTNPIITLQVTNHLSVRAVFARPLQALITGNGTVRFVPSPEEARLGDTITAYATPAVGNRFVRWQEIYRLNHPTYTFTYSPTTGRTRVEFAVSTNNEVALFASAIPNGILSILDGQNWIDFNQPSNIVVPAGTTVHLRANSSPGRVFSGWAGALEIRSSLAAVTVVSNSVIDALFVVPEIKLSVLNDHERVQFSQTNNFGRAVSWEASVDLQAWFPFQIPSNHFRLDPFDTNRASSLFFRARP